MDKETRLSVRVSPEELEQLKAYASAKNKTLADWVRETLLVAAEIQEDRMANVEKRLAALEARFG